MIIQNVTDNKVTPISTFKDNRVEVNTAKVGMIFNISQRVINTLLTQVNDGVLGTVYSSKDLNEVNANIESIVASKLKSKFNIQ